MELVDEAQLAIGLAQVVDRQPHRQEGREQHRALLDALQPASLQGVVGYSRRLVGRDSLPASGPEGGHSQEGEPYHRSHQYQGYNQGGIHLLPYMQEGPWG